jgi:hypothetical protein
MVLRTLDGAEKCALRDFRREDASTRRWQVNYNFLEAYEDKETLCGAFHLLPEPPRCFAILASCGGIFERPAEFCVVDFEFGDESWVWK